jgi:hypothetical protein
MYTLSFLLLNDRAIEFLFKKIYCVYFSNLSFWWQLNSSNIEHVRIVIDQNYESDHNNNTTSFLIVSLMTFIKWEHTNFQLF